MKRSTPAFKQCDPTHTSFQPPTSHLPPRPPGHSSLKDSISLPLYFFLFFGMLSAFQVESVLRSSQLEKKKKAHTCLHAGRHGFTDESRTPRRTDRIENNSTRTRRITGSKPWQWERSEVTLVARLARHRVFLRQIEHIFSLTTHTHKRRGTAFGKEYTQKKRRLRSDCGERHVVVRTLGHSSLLRGGGSL